MRFSKIAKKRQLASCLSVCRSVSRHLSVRTELDSYATDFHEICYEDNTDIYREKKSSFINPLNAEFNPICYLLALLAHHFLHVSRIRVISLTFRRLMSYIYMEHPFLMFLDHTQRRSTVGRTPPDE